ncbi:hypothetical protein Zmor_007156 [Zophobas morio]|uniref:Uncharacterized protein n=1 Tax=Zophobas morio TaxID=2755281 RepID=A0AA38IYJ1_9CUCU|nr:hypothetical protein Zmor_007156 [Zophobas morio]
MATVLNVSPHNSPKNISFNCDYCKSKVKNKVTCSKCNRHFHFGCLTAALKVKNPKCQHVREISIDDVNDEDNPQFDAISHLIKKVIRNEYDKLRNDIFDLTMEVRNLKKENGKLLKLLTAKDNSSSAKNSLELENNTRTPNVTIPIDTIEDHDIPAKPEDVIAPVIEPVTESLKTAADTIDDNKIETSVSPDPLKSADTDRTINYEWEQPRKQRRHHNPKKTNKDTVTGTAEMTSDENFATTKEHRAWFFLVQIKKDTDPSTIQKYIRGMIPEIKFLETTKLPVNGINSPFKLGTDFELREKIFRQDFWPKGVIIRRFNFKSNSSKPNENFRLSRPSATQT